MLVVSVLYVVFMALVYVAILIIAGYVGVANAATAIPAGNSAGAAGALYAFMSSNGPGIFWVYSVFAVLVYFWVYGRLFLAMPASLDLKTSSLSVVWRLTRKNKTRMMFYLLTLFVSFLILIAALYIMVVMAITVASAISVVILNGEAIDALTVLISNLPALLAKLSPTTRVILAFVIQIAFFMVTMLGWSIIVGSATGAYRDAVEG